jgi:hypothetical protein
MNKKPDYKYELKIRGLSIAKAAGLMDISREFLGQIIRGNCHMPDYIQYNLSTIFKEIEPLDKLKLNKKNNDNL